MINIFANITKFVRIHVISYMKYVLKLFSFIIVFFSLYQIYQIRSNRSSNNSTITKIRSLSQIGMGDSSLTPIKSFKPLEHEFVLNITQFPYNGQWTQFNFPNYKFVNQMGNAEFSFVKGSPFSKLYHSVNDKTMYLTLLIKDGIYIDNFFNGNLSFIFPNDLEHRVLLSKKENKPLIIDQMPAILSYYNGDFFQSYENGIINSTSITVTFYPFEKKFDDYLQYSTSNLWSKISLKIEDKTKDILIELSCEMGNLTEKTIRVFNYSTLLTIISLFQIFYTLNFLFEINANSQMACNFDFICLSFQILWNSLLCAAFFFLSISNETYSLNFGICAMIYFILFSMFELHILFICWKSRFNYLMYSDISTYRKRLLQFYVLFYFLLFSSMISLRFWFNHFGLGYFIFSSNWIFQIIYSAKTGTRPPMRYEYIFWFTLGKTIFPLYLKGCPYNIFELKPEYGKVYLITLFTIIETVILILQKLIGPKFFIPNYLRQNVFDYYKNYEDLIDNSNDCVICLEKLKKKCKITCCLRHDETDIVDEKNNPQCIVDSNSFVYNFALIIVNKLKEHKQRKDYMVTPCFHEFHTPCLEKWIECKKECPYCRRILPSLDD